MKTAYPFAYVKIGRSYAVLRCGGASQGRAAVELGLPPATVADLEARFRARRRRSRDAAHVAAVLAAGGYQVLAR